MRLCSVQEAYFRYMAENPTAGLTAEDEDENIDYDSDGNPIPPTTKKIIMPLPPMDHSEVTAAYCTYLSQEAGSYVILSIGVFIFILVSEVIHLCHPLID